MEQNEPRIIAAQGYCELGMFAEAWEELAPLDADYAKDADLLQLKLSLLMSEARWDEAAQMACDLSEQAPAATAPHLHGAYCLHEAGKTEAARDHLRKAPGHLLKEPIYHYNMACYHCVLGELEDARSYLERSIEMDNNLLASAKEDPDLTPIAKDL